MEQTNNIFNKGLLMDTHPMILGNDSLSDALNATFITMNGNEISLQNDMGNRRIEEAFLPPGYIPLGTKEYGGIIYIVCYNPITNRCLVGSFPSPERNLPLDENTEQDLSFNIETFTENSFCFLQNYNKDKIYVLFNGEVFHTGDRFSLYNDWIWTKNDNVYNGKKYFTNFDNISLENNFTLLYSPKNNYYTLSVGLLNTANEFYDITPSLRRYNETNLLDKTYNSDIDFNKGYFIGKKLSESETESAVDVERSIKRDNIYSNKFASPLCIKVKLNSATNFECSIIGKYYKESKTCDLEVRGELTYNCPDGAGEEKHEDFEYLNYGKYYTYLLSLTNEFRAFDFYVKKNNKYELQEQKGKSVSISYSSDKNLYYSSDWQTFKNIAPTKEENNLEILEYFIGIPTFLTEGYGCESNPYLRELSIFGQLDISNLNKYEVPTVIKWLFSTVGSTTTLNYEFGWNTDIEVTNIEFRFTPTGDYGSTIVSSDHKERLGSIRLENQDRTAYEVSITFSINDSDNVIINGYWVLCTTLFNGLEDTVGDNYVFPTTSRGIEEQLKLLHLPLQLVYTLNPSNTDISSTSIDYGTNNEYFFSSVTELNSNELNKKCTITRDFKFTSNRIPISITSVKTINTDESKYPKYIIDLLNNISINLSSTLDSDTIDISSNLKAFELTQNGRLSNNTYPNGDNHILCNNFKINRDGNDYYISFDLEYDWKFIYNPKRWDSEKTRTWTYIRSKDNDASMFNKNNNYDFYMGPESAGDNKYYLYISKKVADSESDGRISLFGKDINGNNISKELGTSIQYDEVSEKINDFLSNNDIKDSFISCLGYGYGYDWTEIKIKSEKITTNPCIEWGRAKKTTNQDLNDYYYIPYAIITKDEETNDSVVTKQPIMDMIEYELLSLLGDSTKIINIFYPLEHTSGKNNIYGIISNSDKNISVKEGSYYNYGVLVNLDIAEQVINDTLGESGDITNDPLNIFKYINTGSKITNSTKTIDFIPQNDVNHPYYISLDGNSYSIKNEELMFTIEDVGVIEDNTETYTFDYTTLLNNYKVMGHSTNIFAKIQRGNNDPTFIVVPTCFVFVPDDIGYNPMIYIPDDNMSIINKDGNNINISPKDWYLNKEDITYTSLCADFIFNSGDVLTHFIYDINEIKTEFEYK